MLRKTIIFARIKQAFNLTCNSAAHDTRAQVNATAIRKLNVRFTAGKDLKAALQKAQFVPAENMTGSEERKYSFGTGSFVGKYEHNYNRTITISEEGDQTTTRCRRGNPTVVNGSGKIAS